MTKEKLKELAIKYINESVPTDGEDWLVAMVDFAYEQQQILKKEILEQIDGYIHF